MHKREQMIYDNDDDDDEAEYDMVYDPATKSFISTVTVEEAIRESNQQRAKYAVIKTLENDGTTNSNSIDVNHVIDDVIDNMKDEHVPLLNKINA